MNSGFDKDLYDILGVPPDASLADMREARTRLLKRYHPDKGGDEAPPSPGGGGRGPW